MKFTMRTFVAVEISDKQVINRISKFQSEINIHAKPVEAQNLHFTMQFLGEISDKQAYMIKDALKEIKFTVFSITFKGIGAFPGPKSPRVIWVGTDKSGGNALIDLAKRIENVLSPLGFRNDKPFRPHVTVFRIKNRNEDLSEKLEKYKSLEFGSQEIINFKFKQSVLTPNGPIYSDLYDIRGEK